MIPNYLRTLSNKPALFFLIAFLAGSLISILIMQFKLHGATNNSCYKYKLARVKGYENVQPLLSVQRVNESKRFAPLKKDLAMLLDSLKAAGAIEGASVYIEEFSQGRWMALNGEQQFHPASLMKVSLMLCYLRMAEATPGLLTQKWVFEKPDSVQITPQYYNSLSIEQGKEYTVHELLYHMMAYSDNNATWLLSSRFDKSNLNKLFDEFDLPQPVEDDLKFTMNSKEYSIFLKAIYNVAYLSPEYSEYAANLLSHSTFEGGFIEGFPKNTKMWRKFGEWNNGGNRELHEAGVVYIHDVPYLITVMTAGADTEKLAETISAICKNIYQEIESNSKLMPADKVSSFKN